MQKLLSISLLFALTLQCFSNLGVIAGYELNKQYIASVLCVNRDNSSMHCDGKCYLDKKLQQDQQRKNNENGLSGNKLDVVLFCTTEQFFFSSEVNKDLVEFPPFKYYVYPSPHFNFFHPPKMNLFIA